MRKFYVIRAVNKKTGEYLYSRTNNVKQRLSMLQYNIDSINGKGTAVYDRFKPFIGVSEQDVSWEIYKQVS